MALTINEYYLLGVLNSKIVSVLLADLRSGDYHIYPEHLRNIPIPFATVEEQEYIAKIVLNLVNGGLNDEKVDIANKEIDSLVESLYSKAIER